jgi:predicted MFS family arabinose efflux permease
MVAGLVAGAVHWKVPDHRRFRIGTAVLAAAMLALPFVGDLVALGVLFLFVGLSLAPGLIAVVSLLEASTPRSRLTEAMAVFQTGISAGIAPGAWLAGFVADRASGSAAYWVCVVSGALALAAAFWCRPAPASPQTASSLPA